MTTFRKPPAIVFAKGTRPPFGAAFRAAPHFPWEWPQPSFAQIETLRDARHVDRAEVTELEMSLRARMASLRAQRVRADEQLANYLLQHMSESGIAHLRMIDGTGRPLTTSIPALWPDVPADLLTVLQERERLGVMIDHDKHALAAVTRMLSETTSTFWERVRAVFQPRRLR